MKGGRPKWHFVGIVDGAEEDVEVSVDAFVLFEEGEDAAFGGVGAGVSRLLVTECNFC